MQTALIIFFAIVAIFSAAVIISAIRKSLRHRAAIRRRLAEIGARHTGKSPLFAAPYGSENFHPDWGGRAEVTSEASLYQRVRSARMNEIIRAADSMSYDDLVQAAIRLGSTHEIAAAYAAEILISEDEGEELPAAMAHSPNVGGIGQPRYRGGNYVDEQELVDEMKGVRHYGTEPAVDPLTSLLTTGRVPVTGYRNPVKALAAGVKACGAKIDTASFDRLAEQRGDSRPEEIADGFIIRGYDDLQRLCELGNVVIATDPKSGLVVCHDPAEWQSINPVDALVQMGVEDDDNAAAWRDRLNEPVEVGSGTGKIDFTQCRLGDELPIADAGRIDANGNITWRVGQALSSGRVTIHRDEEQKAIEAGWRLVTENVQQGTDFLLVERP